MQPRKLAKRLALIPAAVVAGAAVAEVLVGVEGSRGKVFVESSLPAIASRWSSGELASRATLEFLRTAPIDRIDSAFGAARRNLGPLKALRGCQGGARLAMAKNGLWMISARYACRADFERASARIAVGIVKRGGGWLISSFEVDSAAYKAAWPQSLRARSSDSGVPMSSQRAEPTS
jgi:hypothetical protein